MDYLIIYACRDIACWIDSSQLCLGLPSVVAKCYSFLHEIQLFFTIIFFYKHCRRVNSSVIQCLVVGVSQQETRANTIFVNISNIMNAYPLVVFKVRVSCHNLVWLHVAANSDKSLLSYRHEKYSRRYNMIRCVILPTQNV